MPASDHSTPDTTDPPVPRFKRRKTTHTKRARADERIGEGLVAPTATATATAVMDDDARTDAPTLAPTTAALPTQLSGDNEDEDEHGVSGLREALKKARLAEQHHVKYGTPIPAHLAALVGANSSSNKNKNTSSTASATTSTTNDPASKPPQNTTPSTTAARNGKLEEVALPTPTPPNPPTANPQPRVRLRRDGTPFRPRRARRTSNDMRRDALVESILSESRIEYFAPPATSGGGGAQGEAPLLTEEEMLRQFEDEYRDAAEARRPNPLPPAGKASGAGDSAKSGPKLGGSRSARAAMAAREKEKNPWSKR
ncbi:hypothetical protein E8E13_005762 [Curvularia kusanoi]|uniref:Uncharacterized protein n=1 Tax=Curvularia kusanoi TaxID=90978 RepID=A0A9P4W3C6_CURKU|nr:hypothetical protein E8E13_005762 [Curvularia kusanoi]